MQESRVSDDLLRTFITEQREFNRVSDLRQSSIEDIVIGPPLRGSTGAPILNGDGLPMRDMKKGLAGRRTWRLGIVPTALQLAALTTAVLVLLSALGP